MIGATLGHYRIERTWMMVDQGPLYLDRDFS
jgi:hypothetical protein